MKQMVKSFQCNFIIIVNEDDIKQKEAKGNNFENKFNDTVKQLETDKIELENRK